MAATNIFYRIPSHRGTRIATIAGPECTLNQFCEYIAESEGLDIDHFIIAYGTKIFRPHTCCLQAINLQNNSNVDVLIPLLGGKGGFGSLLRAIGAQIEKTTNRDACRDLSGRRLRDIKREDDLRKLIALQEKLKEERTQRKQEKLDRLKKTVEDSSRSASIQELVNMFDDHEYNKRRLEISDIIEAAVDKGIINFKKRQQEDKEDSTCKRLRVESELDEGSPSIEENNSQSNNHETNAGSREIQSIAPKARGTHAKIRKDELWLGLDVEEDEEEKQDIQLKG